MSAVMDAEPVEMIHEAPLPVRVDAGSTYTQEPEALGYYVEEWLDFHSSDGDDREWLGFAEKDLARALLDSDGGVDLLTDQYIAIAGISEQQKARIRSTVAGVFRDMDWADEWDKLNEYQERVGLPKKVDYLNGDPFRFISARKVLDTAFAAVESGATVNATFFMFHAAEKELRSAEIVERDI